MFTFLCWRQWRHVFLTLSNEVDPLLNQVFTSITELMNIELKFVLFWWISISIRMTQACWDVWFVAIKMCYKLKCTLSHNIPVDQNCTYSIHKRLAYRQYWFFLVNILNQEDLYCRYSRIFNTFMNWIWTILVNLMECDFLIHTVINNRNDDILT